MGGIESWIPIAFFAAAVGIVAIIFNYFNNEKRRRYALVEKAIESGQQIPENVFREKGSETEKRSFEYFKTGIIFTFLSAAFWVIFLTKFNNGFPFLFVAAFFTAFGLAFLLIGLLKKNQEKNEEKAKNE